MAPKKVHAISAKKKATGLTAVPTRETTQVEVSTKALLAVTKEDQEEVEALMSHASNARNLVTLLLIVPMEASLEEEHPMVEVPLLEEVEGHHLEEEEMVGSPRLLGDLLVDRRQATLHVINVKNLVISLQTARMGLRL
jgi:hypothetical protein